VQSGRGGIKEDKSYTPLISTIAFGKLYVLAYFYRSVILHVLEVIKKKLYFIKNVVRCTNLFKVN